jgi:hypothetical protein
MINCRVSLNIKKINNEIHEGNTVAYAAPSSQNLGISIKFAIIFKIHQNIIQYNVNLTFFSITK